MSELRAEAAIAEVRARARRREDRVFTVLCVIAGVVGLPAVVVALPALAVVVFGAWLSGRIWASAYEEIERIEAEREEGSRTYPLDESIVLARAIGRDGVRVEPDEGDDG